MLDEQNNANLEHQVKLIAWLSAIQRDFDPLLLKGRKLFNESAGWFWVWFARSLFTTSYKKVSDDSASSFMGIFSSRWQSILTYLALAGLVVPSHLFNLWTLPFWPSVISYGIIGVSIIMSFVANLNRMLTLSDPYFNSNLYRLMRKQEYNMFITYFKEPLYTFENALDWVKLLYKENDLDSVVAEHKDMNRQLREMMHDLKIRLDEREESLKMTEKTIELLNRKINLLQSLTVINEDGFNSAISTIYRLRGSDSLFNTADLRVVTDYSLFELVGTDLIRICEQGTTLTPKIININDSAYEHYSSVQLVRGLNTIEKATSDREGRTVASYWIDLPSGRTLIYNFHYDSTSTTMDGIIEMKEMYRYIKGICMHLEERGFLIREGEYHVAK